MKPVLNRILLTSLTVPVMALLGTTSARADAQPSAADTPMPTLTASAGEGHDHSGMDSVPEWPGSSSQAHDHGTGAGTDSGHGAGTDSGHGEEHDGGTAERPRAAVLGGFGAVNLGVLAAAAVVRRRARRRTGERHGDTRTTAGNGRSAAEKGANR